MALDKAENTEQREQGDKQQGGKQQERGKQKRRGRIPIQVTSDAILEVLAERGRPMAVFELQNVVKGHLGRYVEESTVRDALVGLRQEDKVVLHKGQPRKIYNLYGLPGQEVPEDLDRSIRHKHGTGKYKARW